MKLNIHISKQNINNMNHQDWKEVVFNKASTEVKKPHVELSKSVKLEKDSENLANKRVGLSLGKQIQTGRIAKGFKTQKELATRVNVRPEIINKYENGTAVPDTNVLQKLRQVLGVKLQVK